MIDSSCAVAFELEKIFYEEDGLLFVSALTASYDLSSALDVMTFIVRGALEA